MKHFKSILVLLLCWNPARAAGANPAESGKEVRVADQPTVFQWAGDQFIVTNSTQSWIKAKDHLSGKISILKLSDGAMGQTLWNGVVTSFRLVNQRTALSRRALQGTWQDYPTILDRGIGSNGMRGYPFLLFESSKEGRFFSYSRMHGFVLGEESSICSWWKQGPNGTLEPDDLIHLELEYPIFLAEHLAPNATTIATSSRYLGLEPFLDYPLRFSGGFVVVSWGAGVIWIISDDPTVSNRTIKLAASDQDFFSGKKRHNPALLGIQVTPNNRILAALRSDVLLYEGLEEGEKGFKNVPACKDESEGAQKTKELHKILWKEIDPSDGNITEPDLLNYPGAPAAFIPDESFMFSFDLNGVIVINGREERPPEAGEDAEKPNKEKASEAMKPKNLKTK